MSFMDTIRICPFPVDCPLFLFLLSSTLHRCCQLLNRFRTLTICQSSEKSNRFSLVFRHFVCFYTFSVAFLGILTIVFFFFCFSADVPFHGFLHFLYIYAINSFSILCNFSKILVFQRFLKYFSFSFIYLIVFVYFRCFAFT